MGGHLKPLPRLCPKSERKYMVKLQEFDTYARRDIRVEAIVLAPKLDALIGDPVSSNSCLAFRGHFVEFACLLLSSISVHC